MEDDHGCLGVSSVGVCRTTPVPAVRRRRSRAGQGARQCPVSVAHGGRRQVRAWRREAPRDFRRGTRLSRCPSSPVRGRGRPPRLLHLEPRAPHRLGDRRAAGGRAARRLVGGVPARLLHVVLSPGPGTPTDEDDFAVGREVLLDGSVPVLGVCLGMQGLVTAYGGVVDRVAPAHGDLTTVEHDGRGRVRRCAAGLQGGAVPLAGGAVGARRPGRHRARRRRHGDGGAAPLAAAGGRAVPSRVGAQRARRAAGRELPGRARG